MENETVLNYLQRMYHGNLPFAGNGQVVLRHFGRKHGILKMFNDLDFKVGVEVGTERGIYAHRICEKCPNLKLYCVDPWLAYSEAGLVYTQEDFDSRYEEARARLKDFNCEIIKEKSMDALSKFEDDSLDFAFIDGDHHYEHVLEDIRGWYKKVKPGRVLYGHDFVERDDFGVVKAVRGFVKENNIPPLFICHVPFKSNGVGFVDCWMLLKGGTHADMR
ncbi:MAG: hypothetical protein UY48_C0051G0014 [Candidatus Gottesmanbacteria bacterium GW2011_GWB1_49_7]|uniref:Class I SAM-dependent methyltransferase n=1 Tax=Candidatus Gottesmanbacteria bacterium GW2011_GWB1_49_7 TaxID=1618448 RepID=A0A0G1Y4U1_9BACT|nr:MAG: hypothetical protein UY48_C0051G0014 [Candidatus Gottesmanbacteria bacterium GW2011_GWB1_49_7]